MAGRQPRCVGDRSSASREDTLAPKPFRVEAEDGFLINGFCWRHSGGSRDRRSVVIINPATAVRCRYYFRFAAFLFRHGFDVITYDYRGIGRSRPTRLSGFDAHWIDWGQLDFEAVLRFAELSFGSQAVDVVAHSVGGFILGFAKSNYRIRRVVTVGAQYAYWPDYAAGSKLRMFAKWHVAMPLITALFGYFPGKRLGWLEDTPKGIVRDWVARRARFEDTWRDHPIARYRDAQALVRQFSAVGAAILAVSATDDAFGTVPAVERLLAYFDHSARTHLRVSPESVGASAIGHFGFFDSQFEEKLWKIALAWLACGRLPVGCPGVLITRGESNVERRTEHEDARGLARGDRGEPLASGAETRPRHRKPAR